MIAHNFRSYGLIKKKNHCENNVRMASNDRIDYLHKLYLCVYTSIFTRIIYLLELGQKLMRCRHGSVLKSLRSKNGKKLKCLVKRFCSIGRRHHAIKSYDFRNISHGRNNYFMFKINAFTVIIYLNTSRGVDGDCLSSAGRQNYDGNTLKIMLHYSQFVLKLFMSYTQKRTSQRIERKKRELQQT